MKGIGVLLATLVLVVVYVSASPNQERRPQVVTSNESTSKAGTRMDGLLDFVNYQKLFNKSYSGFLEEAVRFKYFTASALQTVAAAIKYRFRLINHYLSLNHMSDWTREEFEKMKNKAFAEWARSVNGDRDQPPPTSPPEASSPKFVPGDNEDVVQEIRELVDGHEGEPVYEELGELLGAKSSGQHERKKREADQDKALPPRDLPIEKLINAGEAEKSPEGWEEQRLNVPSNNPLFVPAKRSTKSFKKAQRPVAWHSYESHDRAIYELGPVAGAFDFDYNKVERNLVETISDKQPDDDARDQVFIDWRESGCIAPILKQGECGSCYAFASTSIMEFLYCKNTGQKVRFSPQYMIDCGKHVRMKGCGGGNPMLVPNFIRNFGLYPSKLYPYQDKEGQCPYDEQSVDLEQTGYIRSNNFARSFIISSEFWGDTLTRGLLMIGSVARFGSDFQQYGGGVLMGNCQDPPSHAVVLIGHGRKDGREYWIIRNSWGTDWGERGYIRVDKESNCIKPSLGFVYGESNPGEVGKMTFVNNKANDAEAVSRLIRDKGLSEDDANAALGQHFDQ